MVYCVLCPWFWFFLLLTQRQSSWDKWCFHVKPSKSKQVPDYISIHRWAFTEWCFGTRHYTQPQSWEQGWSVFYRCLSRPEKALLEHSKVLSCLCLPPPTAKLLLAFQPGILLVQGWSGEKSVPELGHLPSFSFFHKGILIRSTKLT